MLSEEVLDKVVERLTNRIERGNEYILAKIGQKVDEIGKLRPTEAQQLEQILKYGGDYEKILNKLAQITKLNKKDIEKIFEEVAKKDYQFAEKFYKYRNKKYVPYNENAPLRKQVDALAKLTNDRYTEIARSKAIGFSVRDKKGNVVFKGLKSTYNEVIDRAILNVAQGKITFQEEMYKILKDIGESGVKTLDFNGRTMRLDSAIRMHMKDSLRQLHNEMQMQYGEEFDADGVEISVHMNPAPDHEEVQGRQFSITEFNKFQSDEDAVSYDGIEFSADFEGHDRRSISQYNCYHKIFPIILGVSKPEYSNEELQQIIDDNHKGFMLDGKKYTNYEGTQLQRQLELKIREQKDLQILGRSSGNEKLAQESQKKINQLNKKYKELAQASGLPTYNDRMRVSGYRPIKVIEKPIEIQSEITKPNISLRSIKDSNSVFVPKEDQQRLVNHYIDYYEKRKSNHSIISNYETERYNRFLRIKQDGFKDEEIKLTDRYECNRLLDYVNAELVDTEIEQLDFKVVQSITKQVYNLSQKSPSLTQGLDMNRLWIRADDIPSTGEYRMGQITFNIREFNNYDEVIKSTKEMIDKKWWCEVEPGYEQYHTITHEYGHFFHQELKHTAIYPPNGEPISKSFDYFYNKYGEVGTWGGRYIPYEHHKEIEADFIYEPIRRLAVKEGLSEKQIISKYISGYGIREGVDDMFAEVFTNSQLGKSNALGDELIEFLKELGEWNE